MGRATGKVTLKHINNESVRKSAFNQRNKGLTKKVSEFSKKFGVEACLIVYDGDGDGKPMTWPQDSATLQSMLAKYEQQKNETTTRIFDVKDYFANKKNLVEAEIKQARKKIIMNKYPTWGPCFNNLEMEQLKGLVDIVDLKIQACNQRIDMLKNMQQGDQTSFKQNTVQMQSVAPENVVSLQSSQPDDAMKPLVNIDEMIDFTDLGEWDDSFMQNTVEMQSVAPKNVASLQSSQPDDPMKPLINIDEMIDFTDLVEWDNIMPKNNVFSSDSSELDVMHNNIPEMQHIPAPLKSLENISMAPISSTKQLDEFVKLDDLMDESDQEWANQLADLDDWAANKLDDDDGYGDGIVNLVREPDVFEWQNYSFSSEIEQQCSALDVFSQPRYGF